MSNSDRQPLIQALGLTLGYGRNVVLDRIDFNVEHGSAFAILGGSGSGKSTILRALVGLVDPLDGELRVDVETPAGLRQGAPAFGVLFQSGALFGSMTLAQNVALPLARWTDLDMKSIEAIVRAKLRLVGLERFENHFPAEISGGMKKRAGIARAIALDPPILFLDEPSAGLDPIATADLDRLLITLNRDLDVSLVIVTHELESVFRVADSCILVDGARHGIVGRGEPRRLAAESRDPFVRSFFDSYQVEASYP